MSIKFLNEAWSYPFNAHEKIVLLAIADCANDEGVAYPSYKALCKKTGMAKATLAKHLNFLRGLGVISTENHSEFGRGKSVNVYTISSRVELPYSSDIELMDKIKQLRVKNASPKSSILGQPKVQFSDTKSSTLEHEPSIETSIKEPSCPSPSEVLAGEIVETLHKRIVGENPKARIKPESWIADIEKAIRIDGRTEDELVSVINWIYSDGGAFWRPNILSGNKLRQKFDTMYGQMMRDKPQKKVVNDGYGGPRI